MFVLLSADHRAAYSAVSRERVRKLLQCTLIHCLLITRLLDTILLSYSLLITLLWITPQVIIIQW